MEENENQPPVGEERSSTAKPYYGEQNEDGIDLSLIRENLKLTPTERLIRHQRALEFIREVRRAGIAAGLRKPD